MISCKIGILGSDSELIMECTEFYCTVVLYIHTIYCTALYCSVPAPQLPLLGALNLWINTASNTAQHCAVRLYSDSTVLYSTE